MKFEARDNDAATKDRSSKCFGWITIFLASSSVDADGAWEKIEAQVLNDVSNAA
jgi:hypothetical protein